MRWASLLVLALSVGLGRMAYADGIDRRADQLSTSKSYKVRLSAAIYLAKKKDARAITALLDALANDSESNIRQIATKGLTKIITDRTPAKVQEHALEVLSLAAEKDDDKTVRRRAKRALRRLAKLRKAAPKKSAVAPSFKPPSAMFVHVGNANIGKQKAPKGTGRAIQQVVSDKLRSTLSKSYFQMGKVLPTQAQLKKKNIHGWFVGANIDKLSVKQKGDIATVHCSVAVRINRWYGRDAKQRLLANQTASATGNASVTAANTRKEIAFAKSDCLLAVAGQVTTNRVAPFLKQKRPVAQRSSSRKQASKTASHSKSKKSSSKKSMRVSRSSQ